MKTALKFLGILVLVFIVAIVGIPAFLGPPEWTVTATQVIAAPPEVVYAKVARLPSWNEWTNWQGLTFEGPEQGVGAKLAWDGAGSVGELTVTSVKANEELRYELTMEGGTGESSGTIALAPEGDGTKVTWTDSGHFVASDGEKVEGGVGGYFLRYGGAAMRTMLGKGLEDNLARLANLVDTEN